METSFNVVFNCGSVGLPHALEETGRGGREAAGAAGTDTAILCFPPPPSLLRTLRPPRAWAPARLPGGGHLSVHSNDILGSSSLAALPICFLSFGNLLTLLVYYHPSSSLYFCVSLLHLALLS